MKRRSSGPEAASPLTKAHVTAFVRGARARFAVPAVAVAVMNSEGVEVEVVEGERVVGQLAQATLDDAFHIGSCSKSVLAVMAAKLVEQGRIAWSTRFFEVLPELEAGAQAAYGGVTLEDLFLCEAGIQPFTDGAREPLPTYASTIEDPRRAFARDLVARPPASERRQGRFRHRYSNASYALAALMLERVSGLPYEEHVRRTLADGFGAGVHLGWPHGIGADQPWGHMLTKSGVTVFGPEHPYRIPELLTPAGDLSMTPRGFAAYVRQQLRGLRGSNGYLSSASYQRIHFGRRGFSLGVANGALGGKRFSGLDGSAGTFFCRAVLVPEADFALTLMTNAGSGSGSMRVVDWLTLRIVKRRFGWWWRLWL